MSKALQQQPQVRRQELGIAVGDLVQTSYDTGPYEVTSIYGPHYIQQSLDVLIWPYPVISLSMARDGKGGFTLNDIRQYVLADGSSRWFNDANDEIFVRSGSVARTYQLDLFGAMANAAMLGSLARPYAWQPGVDYAAASRGEIKLWRCYDCARDFAADSNGYWMKPARCDQCGKTNPARLIIMPPCTGHSSFTMQLNRNNPAFLAALRQSQMPDELLGLRAVGEVDIPGSRSESEVSA